MFVQWYYGIKSAMSKAGRSRRELRRARERSQRDLVERQALARIACLEEELKKLQSVNRIQQTEIDELSAVIARNLERVKSETRELASAARLAGSRGSAEDPAARVES